MTSSFAELTPVSTSSTDFSVKTQHTNDANNDFHLLIQELEYDEDDYDFASRESPEKSQVDDEEEDEDIYVRYPYERKDKYAHLQEKMEEKLVMREAETREIDEKAEEARQLFKTVTEKRKMDQKLTEFHLPLDTIFSCVVCSKAFPTAEQLQHHSARAHDTSKNSERCNLCGKSYKHKKNLVIHMAIHRKEFACGKCNLVFQSEAALELHITKLHTEAEEAKEVAEVMCYMCRKVVPQTTLKQHQWYCKNKQNLLERKKKSDAERRVAKSLSVPPSPAMSIASVSSFASFQPGPSGFSPVVSPSVSYRDKSCRVCGENFASRQSMLRHVGRKHPEAKDDPNVTSVRYVSVESPSHQYACTDCGKRLTTRAALTTHRARAHLKEARHECHICQKMYTVPSELRKHIQRVHEKEAKPSTSKVQLADLPEIDDIF